MPRSLPRCSHHSDRGRRCHRPGIGNPPLCPRHAHEWGYTAGTREEYDLNAYVRVLESLLELPVARRAFRRVGEIVDEYVDRATGRPIDPTYYENAYAGDSAPGHAPPGPPPPLPDAEAQARTVLGFTDTEPLTGDLIRQRKRALAQALHPDRKGGSEEAMRRVNAAADMLLSRHG